MSIWLLNFISVFLQLLVLMDQSKSTFVLKFRKEVICFHQNVTFGELMETVFRTFAQEL